MKLQIPTTELTKAITDLHPLIGKVDCKFDDEKPSVDITITGITTIAVYPVAKANQLCMIVPLRLKAIGLVNIGGRVYEFIAKMLKENKTPFQVIQKDEGTQDHRAILWMDLSPYKVTNVELGLSGEEGVSLSFDYNETPSA